MDQKPRDIEAELRRIIERRIIKEEPRVGAYSWICIAKSIPDEKGQSYYKIGHTARLETYLAKLNREDWASKDTTPLVLKIWGGASYFVKIIRRIFKDKRRSRYFGKKIWFALNDEDISWLKRFRIAKNGNIQSEIFKIFGESNPSLVSRLKKEGLW